MSSGARVAGAGGAATALVLAPILVIGLLAGGVVFQPHPPGVDIAKVPPLAAELLPELDQLIADHCPELPLLWAVAHIHVESGWNAAAYNADGAAAGLYQFTEPSWTAAGGLPWPSAPPPPTADVLQPLTHLRLAVPWVCANLRAITPHLRSTGKPTDPLDALLVCHIAGCGRVTASTTGVPTAGEAGCGTVCAAAVRRYIDAVHTTAERFAAAPAGPVPIEDLPTPVAHRGPSAGCTDDDPTSDGCLTPATRHALTQILATFGQPGPRSAVRSATCWDPHAWNPTSDHPRGKACDFFPTPAGTFPAGAELEFGWRMATWLRAHAEILGVRYIIWQGRIWSPNAPDRDGWGRAYTGGGIYDPRDATGGHWDHLHVSFR